MHPVNRQTQMLPKVNNHAFIILAHAKAKLRFFAFYLPLTVSIILLCALIQTCTYTIFAQCLRGWVSYGVRARYFGLSTDPMTLNQLISCG